MDWQPIETAPRDGTWFLICRASEGEESYEVGRYRPLTHDTFVLVDHDRDGALYRRDTETLYDWDGFNNFHRATHWTPAPPPPSAATA